jgi:hypothetical protein
MLPYARKQVELSDEHNKRFGLATCGSRMTVEHSTVVSSWARRETLKAEGSQVISLKLTPRAHLDMLSEAFASSDPPAQIAATLPGEAGRKASFGLDAAHSLWRSSIPSLPVALLTERLNTLVRKGSHS